MISGGTNGAFLLLGIALGAIVFYFSLYAFIFFHAIGFLITAIIAVSVMLYSIYIAALEGYLTLDYVSWLVFGLGMGIGGIFYKIASLIGLLYTILMGPPL